jgi:prevent-host-death family protein
MIWRFSEAKNKLSEVVSRALTERPQRIRHRGQVVVVLSEDDFERLSGNRKSFGDYLLRGLDLTDLDLSRDQSPMRDVTT